jgi:hypothetical protein
VPSIAILVLGRRPNLRNRTPTTRLDKSQITKILLDPIAHFLLFLFPVLFASFFFPLAKAPRMCSASKTVVKASEGVCEH